MRGPSSTFFSSLSGKERPARLKSLWPFALLRRPLSRRLAYAPAGLARHAKDRRRWPRPSCEPQACRQHAQGSNAPGSYARHSLWRFGLGSSKSWERPRGRAAASGRYSFMGLSKSTSQGHSESPELDPITSCLGFKGEWAAQVLMSRTRMDPSSCHTPSAGSAVCSSRSRRSPGHVLSGKHTARSREALLWLARRLRLGAITNAYGICHNDRLAARTASCTPFCGPFLGDVPAGRAPAQLRNPSRRPPPPQLPCRSL